MAVASDRVRLRYFDCRGRAQAIRNALVCAEVAFDDERIAVGPNWRTLKEQSGGGPFGSLPVLEWGSDCVAQTLPIAGYVARRVGEYDGLDAVGIARLEMIASAAYLDVISEIVMMIWMPTAIPEPEAATRLSNHEARIFQKIERLERMLASGEAPFFGGARPFVADFFVEEAIDMARTVLGERLEKHLRRAPRLVEMKIHLASRPPIVRYIADGKRPTRLTGSPSEPESLERIRNYVVNAGR